MFGSGVLDDWRRFLDRFFGDFLREYERNPVPSIETQEAKGSEDKGKFDRETEKTETQHND